MDVSNGDSGHYGKFQKDKSKSPVMEETGNSRQSPTRGMSGNTRGSSPDSYANASVGLTSNGYCSSPASSASSSVSNGKTKNVGVGANLNPKRLHGYNSGSGSAKPALSPNSLAGTYPSSEMVGRSSSSSALAIIPRNPSPTSSLPTAGPPLPGQGAPAPGAGNGKGSSSSEGPSSSGGANPNKMVSQNVNGTLAVTGVPLNESELQLYRVLQRANLLNYYDVMIELGGDDVQQLCDAGEEEFLEIMALVGMASKPLHVRRLQKSLQEWMTQPHLFQIPLISAGHLPQLLPGAGGSGGSDAQGGITSPAPSTVPIRPIPYHSLGASSCGVPGLGPGFINPAEIMKNLQSKLSTLRSQSMSNAGTIIKHESHGSNSSSPVGHVLSSGSMMGSGSPALIPAVIAANSMSLNGNINNGMRGEPSPTGLVHETHHHSLILHDQRSSYSGRHRSEDSSSPSRSVESPQLDSRTSLSPVPFLQDTEIDRLAEAAVNLVGNLPSNAMEPRLSAKKKMCAEYETVIRIPDNDPGRLDVVRKFAAIYGRQDCKRKVSKPLTLHELTVNEAAAQLCSRLPSLLTRRDELFPLARQVVKDAGLPYGSGIASIISSSATNNIHKNGRHEDNMKIHLNNNNNNINNGLMSAVPSNGYGKRIKLDSRGAEDLRSPYSHEAESNSEDSHHTNDSFSISQNRSVITQRQISEDFSSERKSLSHSGNHNCALDMRSSVGKALDEPNDLTISKSFTTGSKCHLSKSGNSSSVVGRNNIKSEPVS